MKDNINLQRIQVPNMRYLIISDIHANLAAFEAVLEDATGLYDEVWCLGDMVGYGPDPNECVELLQTLNHVCIAGNHDWAAIGKLDMDDFNPNAYFAAKWTATQLTGPAYDYLYNLPVGLFRGDFTLVHASPSHPIWQYLMSPKDAQPNFKHFDTLYCLVGHTHIPITFQEAEEPNAMCEALIPGAHYKTLALEQRRLIINPGSVGQPRDDDPRAAYGLLDVEANTFEQRRVPYSVEVTQEKMKAFNFPARIWQRLAMGE